MLNLQIGQILTMSKSDLSGVLACFYGTFMPNNLGFAQTMTEKIPKFEINLRLKKLYKRYPITIRNTCTHIEGLWTGGCLMQNDSIAEAHVGASCSTQGLNLSSHTR